MGMRVKVGTFLGCDREKSEFMNDNTSKDGYEIQTRTCDELDNLVCSALSRLLTHLLVLVRVDGGVPHGAPKPCRAAGRPDLALRVGVLPREAEVEHEDVPHGRRGPPHREVGRLDVPVQEAHVVDGLYSLEDLKGREGLSYMPYLITIQSGCCLLVIGCVRTGTDFA